MEKNNKIKQHFSDRRDLYIGLGSGIIAGAGLATGIFAAKGGVNIAINFAMLNNKPVQTATAIQEVVRRGHPGFVIQHVASGEFVASKNRAMEIWNISRKTLEEGLKNGTYKLVGEATA